MGWAAGYATVAEADRGAIRGRLRGLCCRPDAGQHTVVGWAEADISAEATDASLDECAKRSGEDCRTRAGTGTQPTNRCS